MTKPRRISVDRSGPVVRLKLCRPEASNALDLPMIDALDSAFESLSADSEARIIILSGEGKSFCAGADMGWLRAVDENRPGDWLAAYDALNGMLQRFAQIEKPVICKLSGSVVGAGVAMAAISDIVVADDGCRFMLPELQLGMVPTVVVPHLLARMGAATLRRTFLAETRFNATRAKDMGLVDDVAPVAEVDRHVARLAEDILSAAPDAVRAFKRLLVNLPATSVAGQAEFVRAIAIEGLHSQEMKRGIKAVLDGQSPQWGRTDMMRDHKRKGGSI